MALPIDDAAGQAGRAFFSNRRSEPLPSLDPKLTLPPRVARNFSASHTKERNMAAIQRGSGLEVSEREDYVNSLDAYMDRKQAAAYLGFSEHFLHRKASDPLGPPYKLVGRKTWYRKADLDAYMATPGKRQRVFERRNAVATGQRERPLETAVAQAFGDIPVDPRRDLQSGVQHVTSLDGFETWPDGVYIHPHGVFIKRSNW